MHIERIQIEEGFLDGLDAKLVPGLNVLIGARGTGKTSIIELIRFCLDVKSYSTETGKTSRDHALSVLGRGQVTVTLANGPQKITVSRAVTDASPRTSSFFPVPIIFSQKEIEAVGLQASGRLQLLDGFINDRRQHDVDEADAVTTVRSLTVEAEAIRREVDDFNRQVFGLDSLKQQLTALAPKEQQLTTISESASNKKTQLDRFSALIASHSVAATTIERFKHAIARWSTSLASVNSAEPAIEIWPKSAGEDRISSARERIRTAQKHVNAALRELQQASLEADGAALPIVEQKVALEEQARHLRKEIEALQVGAGAITRQGHDLRERIAQLESLQLISAQRTRDLHAILTRRNAALDRLDKIRQARFTSRTGIATHLNRILGPRIRIAVTHAGQFDAFAAVITDALRGSGMRYNDLAPALAQHISPRELLEATDKNDYDFISAVTGISKDRATRILTQLKDVDLGALATVAVDDYVAFQLLDGPDYKDISELSTGQRCTVVLPLVLRHTDRILIVDQPEDHIDNAFIVDTLIKSIVARDQTGQIIVSTHNANIPVLGNADRVIQLGSDGRRGFALASAALDEPDVVSAISTVMEGGAEAFERRASFYGRHAQH
jgi:AAA domain